MDRIAMVAPDWLNVSRETFERLVCFVALVKKWNPAINLVSKASLAQVWQRHVYDSAQIFLLTPPGAMRWLDLGSGAGFPGMVVAILAQTALPDLRVTLVEADQRKATFLSQAVRDLAIPVTVMTQRIETMPPQNADVLSARALAPLSDLCGFAQRHLSTTGIALLHKGAHSSDEVKQAQKLWQFSLVRYPSRTDPAAAILAVRDVVHG